MMLKIAIVAATAFILSVSGAYAGDFPPDARPDLNCAVVGLQLSGAPDAGPDLQRAGLMIAIYYLGRLHGRLPGVNLEDPMYDAANAMTPDLFAAERVRCGTEVQTVGNDLQAMGARMLARERQQNP